MAITGPGACPVILYANFTVTGRSILILSCAGKVQGYIAHHPVPLRGVPRTVTSSEIPKARQLLRHSQIHDHFFMLSVSPKLYGGLPPMEEGAREEMRKFLDDHPILKSFCEQYIATTAGALVGVALGPGAGISTTLFLGGLIRADNKVSASSKIAGLQAQITKLETDAKAGTITVKEMYDQVQNLTTNSLKTKGDHEAAVQELFDVIQEVKTDLADKKKPVDPVTHDRLSALVDVVDLVSGAIPNKKIAHQVRMAGHASLAFGKAFQMVKELGPIASIGISGLAGPVGLALTGISCIYSLFSSSGDPDGLDAVKDEIQRLSGQIATLESNLGYTLEQLQKNLTDFRIETAIQFRKLSTDITQLRTLSENYYQALNTKVDRLANNLSRGFMAIATMDLNQLIFHAKTRLSENNLTAKKRDDLLIDFAYWATVQAQNAIFTGMININTRQPNRYDDQDIVDILESHTEMELVGYLGYYPQAGGKGLALANPYVWARAVEEYIQLTLNTSALNSSPGVNREQTVRNLYLVGQILQNYIRSLQKNQELFKNLFIRYRQSLQTLQTLSFTEIEGLLSKNTADPRLIALDASFLLIEAFAKLAFHGSCQQDLIFSSLLWGQGKAPMRLMKTQDLRSFMRAIDGSDLKMRMMEIFFEGLLQTSLYAEQVFQQKIANANDTHPIITEMCQRLWLFGNRFYPTVTEFALGTYPIHSTPHFTDVLTLSVTLSYAVRSHHVPAVKALMSTPQVNAKDNLGMTPLHHACLTNQLLIVQYLVNNGADVQARDYRGLTPMHYAIGSSAQPIASFLMGQGASCFSLNEDGIRPSTIPTTSSLIQTLSGTFSKANYTTWISSHPSWGWADAPLHNFDETILLSSFNFLNLNLQSRKTNLSAATKRVKASCPERNLFAYYNSPADLILVNGAVYPPSATTYSLGSPVTSSLHVCITEDFLVGIVDLKTLRCWKLTDGIVTTYTLPKDCVNAKALDKNRVILQFADKSWQVYNIVTGQPSGTFISGVSDLHAHMGYLGIYQRLITAIQNGVPPNPKATELQVWDSETGALITTLKKHSAPIAALLTGTNIFVSVDQTGHTCVWDARGDLITEQTLAIAKPGPVPISYNRIRLLNDEAILYLENMNLCAWDLLNNNQTAVFSAPPKKFLAFDFHRNYLSLIADPKEMNIFQFNNPIQGRVYAPHTFL